MSGASIPAAGGEPVLPPVPELPNVRRHREAAEELEERSRLRRAGLVPPTEDAFARDFDLLTTVWSGGRL